jgi:hypothetical protein
VAVAVIDFQKLSGGYTVLSGLPGKKVIRTTATDGFRL